MFANNCIVQNEEGVMGRVMYHDKYSHVVHTLIRLDTFSWKIEKWDQFRCYEIQAFLWPVETAFACRYYQPYKSPNLKPIDMEID